MAWGAADARSSFLRVALRWSCGYSQRFACGSGGGMHKTYQLSQIDAAVVAAYLVGIVLLGLFVSRRRATEEEFFLASRGAVWPVIGLSLIASNISASTLVGLAGAAYGSGISVYDYEWSAAV